MMPPTGKQLGKQRMPGCTCTYNFTCGACLRGVPVEIEGYEGEVERAAKRALDNSAAGVKG